MLLYGASGHGKVILDILLRKGEKVQAFIDDDPAKKELLNIPVVTGYSSDYEKKSPLLISIGDNLIRKTVADKVKHAFFSAFHESSVVSKYSAIGEGTVMMAKAVVNACSQVGRHCIINTAAVVDHDCVVEDFVHLSPSATLCGGVKIGQGTAVGAGAVVLPGVEIGRWCVIGAGSVVTENVPDYSMVVGVPGKVIKKLSTEL